MSDLIWTLISTGVIAAAAFIAWRQEPQEPEQPADEDIPPEAAPYTAHRCTPGSARTSTTGMHRRPRVRA